MNFWVGFPQGQLWMLWSGFHLGYVFSMQPLQWWQPPQERLPFRPNILEKHLLLPKKPLIFKQQQRLLSSWQPLPPQQQLQPPSLQPQSHWRPLLPQRLLWQQMRLFQQLWWQPVLSQIFWLVSKELTWGLKCSAQQSLSLFLKVHRVTSTNPLYFLCSRHGLC